MSALVHRLKPTEEATGTITAANFSHETAGRIKNLYRSSGWDPYIKTGNLAELVKLSPLCLDEKSKFVQPIPLETMDSWLKETRPWEARSTGWGRDQRRENSESWNANTIFCDLSGYVSENAAWNSTRLVIKTKCKRRMFRPKMSGRGKHWYNVQDAYQNEDPSFPHVTGILTQGFVLREDELSIFELFAMMNLTKLRVKDGALENSQIIPVTIISIGDCKVRVIHGYFDDERQQIFVQKSPIMHFDEPNGYLTDNWKRLLCWLLAEPIQDSVV